MSVGGQLDIGVCVLSPSRLCKYRSGRHTDLDICALVLLPRRILRMCGYAAIIGAATTADQQGGIQILRMCGYAAIIGAAQAQRSYYWCGSGAATQLLSALLRSSYRRCYAALIGAATQLLSALLRSYYRRCYAAILALLPRRISRGGSEKGKGCGLGARAARSTRRKTQKMQRKCVCVSSHHGFNVIFENESSDIKRAHACSAYLHTFHF